MSGMIESLLSAQVLWHVNFPTAEPFDLIQRVRSRGTRGRVSGKRAWHTDAMCKDEISRGKRPASDDACIEAIGSLSICMYNAMMRDTEEKEIRRGMHEFLRPDNADLRCIAT